MNHRRLTAISVLCAVLCSCGVPADSSPKTLSESDIPAGLRPLDPDGSTVPKREQRVAVWFVRDGHLVPVSHLVTAPIGPSPVIAELLLGPTDIEQNQSLRSAIPDPDVFVEVSLLGGVATVAISARFAEIPANDQVLAIGQVVLTLTGLPGVGRVSFAIDGTIVAVPLPSGNATDQSVSRDDYTDLIDTGGTSPSP